MVIVFYIITKVMKRIMDYGLICRIENLYPNLDNLLSGRFLFSILTNRKSGRINCLRVKTA